MNKNKISVESNLEIHLKNQKEKLNALKELNNKYRFKKFRKNSKLKNINSSA